MSGSMLVLAVLAGLFVALFDWFVRLERRGDRHVIFIVVVAVVLLEAALAAESRRTPLGVLRPGIGGFDFRLPDVAFVAMLGARLLARSKMPLRIARGVLPWVAFGSWYATAFVIGRINAEPFGPALFQLKMLFYLLGGMVAASGADPQRLARSLRRPALVLAGLVVLNGVLHQTGIKIAFGTPLQSFVALGRLGNDTVTLFTVLGAFVLLCEAVRARRRVGVLLAGTILLAAPVSGQQRASYAVVGVIVICLLAAVAGRTWRRRSTVRGLDLGLTVGAVIFLLIGLGLSGIAGDPGSLVSGRIDAAFAGEGEAESAEARITIARAAAGEIADRPIFGWGLGHRVTIKPSDLTRVKTLAAHNVVLDIALRSGLVGLALLVVAATGTVLTGLRRWRTEASAETAAVCLGATVGIVAVFAKAMLEPALEWYRLSSLLGVCCGLVLVAGRRSGAPAPVETIVDIDGRPVPPVGAGWQ